MKSKVDVGASAEYLFASECLSKGLIPSWPSTEAMPYDMIIDTGIRRLRVQIKGTIKSTGIVDIQLMMRRGPVHRRYTKKDIDFVAVHLFESDLWYIFPVAKVGASVRLRPDDVWCKNRQFRNAWHLIDPSLKS